MEFYTIEQYQESAQALKEKLGGFQPKVLLILGSGLGFLGDEVENPIIVPYSQVPHMKFSTAPGHISYSELNTTKYPLIYFFPFSSALVSNAECALLV